MPTLKAGIYARVSTADQQTLDPQLRELRRYCKARGWKVVLEASEIGSGAKSKRPQRERLLAAARSRAIDVVVVMRLDRWGRSTIDLLGTLQELAALSVGFACVTQALDLTTPAGRVMIGMLALFAEFERELLRERVKEGVAEAKAKGRRLGRPPSARKHAVEVRQRLKKESVSAIARDLGISRRSVARLASKSSGL